MVALSHTVEAVKEDMHFDWWLRERNMDRDKKLKEEILHEWGWGEEGNRVERNSKDDCFTYAVQY